MAIEKYQDLKKGINIIIKNEISTDNKENNEEKVKKRKHRRKKKESSLEKFMKERELEKFKLSGGGGNANQSSLIKPQPVPFSIARTQSGNMQQSEITPYQAQLLGLLPPAPSYPALPPPTYNAPTYNAPSYPAINFNPQIALPYGNQMIPIENGHSTFIEDMDDKEFQELPDELRDLAIEDRINEKVTLEAEKEFWITIYHYVPRKRCAWI